MLINARFESGDEAKAIHYTNRSGGRASCPDCHVPHEWTHKIARKMQASKEVWARLKANDSRECRNCHNFEFMDITRQSKRASAMHSTSLANGEATCIDCHKGIAHKLPDMSGVKGW